MLSHVAFLRQNLLVLGLNVHKVLPKVCVLLTTKIMLVCVFCCSTHFRETHFQLDPTNQHLRVHSVMSLGQQYCACAIRRTHISANTECMYTKSLTSLASGQPIFGRCTQASAPRVLIKSIKCLIYVGSDDSRQRDSKCANGDCVLLQYYDMIIYLDPRNICA